MAEMKLVVQEIDRVEPHDNADRLEIAFTNIFDWPVIVGKDSFKPGDKVVHFPVDCVVDEKMEDLLLGGSKLKLSKGRIRAAKIRGVVSYGILCPWDKINSVYSVKESNIDLMQGLGCHKYEPPVKGSPQGGGKKIRAKENSSFDRYFNMNHLQNCKDIFIDDDFVNITEKLHGTSFRAGWVKRDVVGIFGKIKHFFRKMFDDSAEWEFVYGSRNVQLQNNPHDKSVYKEIIKKYDLKSISKDTVIYGEIVGPGIQKGYKYTETPELFVYDIKKGGEYVSVNRRVFLTEIFGLNDVPHIISGYWDSVKDDIQSFFDDGSDFDEIIEGVVIETEDFSVGRLGRKKVKVINPEYLLKKDNSDFH